VPHVVEEVTAGAELVETPDVALDLEVVLEHRARLPRDQGLHPDHRRSADRTVGDELPRLHERRVVQRTLADSEDDLSLRAGLDHLARFGDRVRDRFLHRDVLAGRRGSDDVVAVHVRRREDLDRVDVGIGEQIVERRVDLRHAPLGGHAPCLAFSRLAQRDHIAAVVLEVAAGVDGCDVPDSNDP